MMEDKMEITNNMLAVLVVFAMAATLAGTMTIISNIPGQPFSLTGMAQETGSGLANVTLATEASIILVVDTVEFHGIAASVGTSNDTTNFSPHPFVVENNGTARLNISVGESSGDTLWEQNDTSYCFQFNSTANTSSTDANQFMAAAWADFAGNNQTVDAASLDSEGTPNVVWNLSTETDDDRVTVHLRIEVPENELGGVKKATMFFEGTAAIQG